MSQYTSVTFEDAEEYVKSVCEHYKDRRFVGVYGVPRGGLVLAVMLSYRMRIPLLLAPIKDCLIVDDIADTGETLSHYRGYTITTMYYHRQSKITPDYYFKEKGDSWIVFAWEGGYDESK